MPQTQDGARPAGTRSERSRRRRRAAGAGATQKPAAKSKAAPKPPAKKQRAKPPARKKTVAKFPSKANARPEATPTERKQSGQQFFNSMNRKAAKAAVAADPETADLLGNEKDKVRDSALTRGAFGLHELRVSRARLETAHVDRADGVVGGSRSFRRPRRPS